MKTFAIKRGIAALCGLALAASLSVSAFAEEGQTFERAQRPMVGVVTAVDGTTATVELRGGHGGRGFRFDGELPDGVEPPESMEEGERPELPDGAELPEDGRRGFGKGRGRFAGGELPEDAELPERPEKGERPELPEDAERPEREAKTIEVETDAALEVGTMVSIAYDEDGAVTITVLDPEDCQKPERTEKGERPELPEGTGDMVRGQGRGMKGQPSSETAGTLSLRGSKMGRMNGASEL